MSYKQIIDSFCLRENLLLEVKIVRNVENEEKWFGAEFSEIKPNSSPSLLGEFNNSLVASEAIIIYHNDSLIQDSINGE